MNQISGYFLNEDTGKPISNLNVVFYDLDTSGFSQEILASARRNIGQENLYLQLIYGGVDTEEDGNIPLQPRADRLGSTLTDVNGFFSLVFDDEAFNINDKESRPDLLITVLAPDRQLDNTAAWPLGTPELMRLLHLSLYPMRNIGRKEELIIRISAQALAKHNLDTISPIDNFASAVAQPAIQKSQLRSQLREQLNLTDHIQAKKQKKTAAKTFANQISTVKKSVRENSFFINANTTGETGVEEIDRTAKNAGVARLNTFDRIESITPKSLLRLSEQDIIDLNLPDDFAERLARGENVEQELDSNGFCRLLKKHIGGSILERTTQLLDEQRLATERRLRELDVSETSDDDTDTDTDTDTDDSGGDNPSIEEQIKQLVVEQVADLSYSDEEDQDAESGQSARILKNLRLLTPPSSPADVTAFRDFTHLQTAFPDVWREALDRDVTDIIEQLHIEYRELEEDYQGRDATSLFGEDAINPDELDLLEDYVATMRSLGADIAAVGDASEPPEIVKTFYSTRFEYDNADVVVRTSDDERRSDRTGVITNFVYNQQAANDLTTTWPLLSLDQQQELLAIATEDAEQSPQTRVRVGSTGSRQEERRSKLFDALITNLGRDTGPKAAVDLYQLLDRTPEQALETDSRAALLARAQFIIANPEGRVSRVQKMLAGLAKRISEPHSFRVFEKNSINFGIMTTYRQAWKPGDYQVGSLVSTLPLAPGETRNYAKKHTLKKSRSQKENQKRASTLSDERQITARAVADIMDKASSSTNFQQAIGAEAGGKIFGFDVKATSSTQFQNNQTAESQRVKKDFREAVRKAAQEYKNERSVELSTEEINEFEVSSSSKISNPNNEITVTYLFYELERQFRVTEKLHRLSPVVMVAQEVPNPADIDEDWLLSHDWILRRGLLDASFEEALDYISEGMIADEVTLETRREAYKTQKQLVEELTDQLASLVTMQDTLRDTLVQTSEREKLARVARKRAKKRRRSGILKSIFMPVPGVAGKIASGASSLGFGTRGEDPEALEARREALETRLEFLEGTLEDSRARLTRATSALEVATEQLTSAVEENFARRTLVEQLRIHVKDNILHYMQLIWSYEQPDQRFFRLYGLQVPNAVASDTATLRLFPIIDWDFVFNRPADSEEVIDVGAHIPPPSRLATELRRLHEIADLDKLLGFKGNYMIFPLKECVYITDYMMQGYVDDYFGIRDPDPAGNYSTDELMQYAEQIWHKEETTDEERDALRALIQKRLTSPVLDDELIVVPTGQLFIEALKGEHALLENFKRDHRGLDLLKVNEEVRDARLESLRKASRLLQEAPLLDDPDVETRVVVDGDSNVHVDT